MAKIHCVYKISNTINDKIYVGSTISFNQRKISHLTNLRLNNSKNIKLQNFANKYGLETLVFDILEIVTLPENLIKREQFYIDSLNPWFNIAPIAGNCLGVRHSSETKQKHSISKHRKGIKASPQARINQSIGQKERLKKPSELKRIQRLSIGHLTDKEVSEIRAKYVPREYSTRMLAKEYGICQQHVLKIIHFKRRINLAA